MSLLLRGFCFFRIPLFWLFYTIYRNWGQSLSSNEGFSSILTSAISGFYCTVCICRPTLKKDTDQNVLPVLFQYSFQIRQPAIFEPDDIGKNYKPQKKVLNRGTFIYLYSGLSFEVNNFLYHLALKWQVLWVWREF